MPNVVDVSLNWLALGDCHGLRVEEVKDELTLVGVGNVDSYGVSVVLNVYSYVLNLFHSVVVAFLDVRSVLNFNSKYEVVSPTILDVSGLDEVVFACSKLMPF